MLFLAGAAAGSAVDLIASLKQTLESPKAAAGSAANFNVDGAAEAGVATQANPSPPPLPLTPGTMNALLHAQGQSSSKDLMSLLDLDGNGSVSKSEFEQVLGQNGNLAKADDVFAKLDANKDGSVDANEMTAALKKRHGHHHDQGASEAASAGQGGHASQAQKGAKSEKSINPDGSVTTTITYADGSKVSMTTPASASTASANNMLERLIQRQAEMLASSGTSPSLSVSA